MGNRFGNFGDLLLDNSLPYNINIDSLLPANGYGYYDLLDTLSINFVDLNSRTNNDFTISRDNEWKMDIFSIYGIRVKISALDAFTFSNSVTKFYLETKRAYSKLGLVSNNLNFVSAFFNSFELKRDWNFFKWGERNNAGEMPIVMKLYFQILLSNNPNTMKYAKELLR